MNRMGIKDILDILIVSVIIYELIMLIRRTRASAVFKGLVLLLLAVSVSNWVGLTALNWMLMSVIQNGALVMFILFQPEIRKALESLGRGALFEKSHDGDISVIRERSIDEVVQCLLRLSRRKVGALVVFEQKTGLNDVIETGTAIDSSISAALLENIFEPKTPLHDGAVIIRRERIVAAACILPLTENTNISRELGTRHRAGLGVSESTDAVVLIVSEETGVISMARGGTITRYLDEKALRKILEDVYEEKGIRLSNMFRISRKAKGAAK